MAGADPGAVVAMEVFVEQQIVAPIRIGGADRRPAVPRFREGRPLGKLMKARTWASAPSSGRRALRPRPELISHLAPLEACDAVAAADDAHQ